MLYVALGETDDWAHAGRYDLYLDAARRSDDHLRELWEAVGQHPDYADKTSFVVTTDHGRGDGLNGWKNHGRDYPGCDLIWIAVMGPDTPALGVRRAVKTTQAQVAATVAALLGEDFTSADDKIAAALPNVVNGAGERAKTAARITHGPFLGDVTAESALVWAKCSQPGEYQLSAFRGGGAPPVTVTGRCGPERDFCIQWRLDQLRPATRYRYQIEFDERQLAAGDDYFFVTAGSEKPGAVRLAFGSCAREDAGSSAVWRRMRAVDPHVVVLLGDTPYIDSTNLSVQHRRYAEFAAVPEFRDLLRNRPLYATWDDHDFGRNDTDGNLPAKENSRRAFIEYHANPSYGDGRAGIYTKFRRGSAEVFLLDTRFFAGTEPSPVDNERKSLLGKQQWQWLRRELKNSTAPFKILACGMIWNGAVRPGKRDHWATYPHERQALFDFIGQEKIPGVVLIGGDVHRTRVLRHQTIETAGYAIPELITSPVHDGVIATANAPHPALVHDSGEPNTFLLVTIDDRNEPAAMTATFLNKDGRTLYEVKFTESDLAPNGES